MTAIRARPAPAASPARADPKRAEPLGIGTAGPGSILAREVRLLGSLVGQVIVEQAGEAVFELVESTRRRAIAAHGAGSRLDLDVAALEPEVLEALVRAFGLYFQLINLAEERDLMRRRSRRARTTRGGGSEARRLRDALRAQGDRGARLAALDGLSVVPVLTAHPTEARRRTVLVALRRIARLLERMDDPRLTPADDGDVRRHLREEVALLWQTAELRRGSITPLDEVRAAMVFFDETLYRLPPRLYRSVEHALRASARSGAGEARRPSTPGYLRFGSWIGGDRDGHPDVTAASTRAALRIQADHVLRGHEAVATRLTQTLAAKVRPEHMPSSLARQLQLDAAAFPALGRSLRVRYPDEPFRQQLGFVAERLHRTRNRLTGSGGATGHGYASPEVLLTELADLQLALVEARLPRSAWGEVQDFRWQVETFGFHLAGLEIRQHAAIHRARLAGTLPSALASEVDATFATIADLQRQFGESAVQRVIVSFTRAGTDVTDVLRLADAACPGAGDSIDVVPLFESSDALGSAGPILDGLFTDAAYRAHLHRRGDAQEVMLGYSDSNKEVGFLAANWLLHRAQASIVGAARRHGIRLTLFHGRGGPIGRGGGALEQAVMGQPAGSVDLRLKFTEQGEVIAARYGDPDIGLAHLQDVTAATLLASSPSHEASITAWSTEGEEVIDELAGAARRAYRGLVYDDPGFAGFFARITPIDEIAALRLGSRPASRGSGGLAAGRGTDEPEWTIEALRAIPWVFAWSQARIELPGWFGLGSALAVMERRHGETGMGDLARLYRGWPFLNGVLDHARKALERSDLAIGRGYAGLGTEPADARRWQAIESEHQLTSRLLDRVIGERVPARGRSSVALRAPYVDVLSVTQLGLLRALRAREASQPTAREVAELRSLVRLTISGLAAGLQGTG